jgi:hypothetical protein
METQKAHHIGEGLNPPYQFPDMAVEDKPHVMGSLSSTDLITMPEITP